MAENEEPQIFKKRYRVEKKLGAGNFGTAYLVADLKAKDEPKVIKVVRLGEMDPDQSVDSVREAQLLSQLKNDHIVKFYESFLDNDCLCIVTEYCEGGDLDQRIKELKKLNRPLSEDQVVEWLIQILTAVQYMHKCGVLHRDLKTRNIFLKSEKVKIGDFGISRILVGTMDVATTFTGTPYFMSPEVMKHDGYESKSDIWSVGCLLYEMCTFQHAFDGKGLMNVIYKVVEGKPPELPKTYSKALNDVLKKMFTKDPAKRPSATDLLKSPFVQEHRERIKMTGPLENTIGGKIRLKEIDSLLRANMNYGEMQKQSWSLSGQDHVIGEADNDDDDDADVRGATVKLDRLNEEHDEEEYKTVKAPNEEKSARELMIERKMHEADVRAQTFKQASRSNVIEAAQHRQLMRESTIVGSMKQPWPSSDDIEPREQTHKKLAHTFTTGTRNPNVSSNEATYAVRQNNRQTGATVTPSRSNIDDRPITPMKGNYRQIADKFIDDDGIPFDPNLTNEYYAAYSDFEPADDHSPTRERREREFYDQVCRSVNGTDTTLARQRAMSASQRSTINSMSRTIDPRHAAGPLRQSRYIASSRTIGNATKQRRPPGASGNDGNVTLKDNPAHDAFGPVAKDKKISSLRMKAIQTLGESTFEKVYDYFVKQRTAQRTDPTLDDNKIARGLEAFVKKPSDCFLVDQLVFLEMI